MTEPQLFAAPMGGITGANMQGVEAIKNIRMTYSKEPKQMTPVQRHNAALKEKAARVRPSTEPKPLKGRQARIQRKAGQAAGTEAFVHLKPTRRQLGPVPMVPRPELGTFLPSGRGAARRHARYERETSGRREVKTDGAGAA